ncbi:protein translocase subunit yajC [Krasilnikovia cinnamomea]|uniref:Protein translocase subunit yajC n=1 Tax=Krasilnikovia cinnamomea TaxID=349313 RepID=A0A4Q7ZFW0_9ACTN|nr:preprotein translocase subunit YajC [Krasilnikovia cinnamomea]RZU49005.1 protein translocase subunit yajC [Krasilnikovia cinnamomea]
MFLAADPQGGGSFTPLLLIALLFGVMYFMMIRPQQKRRREAQAMQSALGPGDQVVTIGGLHGTVTAADDEVVTIEASPGVELRFARPAIARVVKPETTATAADEAESEPAADAPAAEEPIQSPVVETRKDKD